MMQKKTRLKHPCAPKNFYALTVEIISIEAMDTGMPGYSYLKITARVIYDPETEFMVSSPELYAKYPGSGDYSWIYYMEQDPEHEELWVGWDYYFDGQDPTDYKVCAQIQKLPEDPVCGTKSYPEQ